MNEVTKDTGTNGTGIYVLSSDEDRGAWMQTASGGKFYPLDPRADEIHIDDIAHALSNICRYGGHTTRFLSVAEHCVMVSLSVPEEHALWALLHDASEAYVGDMIRPLKITDQMSAYRDIEDRVHAAVAERFGLSSRMPAEVHDADSRSIVDERAVAMPVTDHAWGLEGLEPLGVDYQCWEPARAKDEFLRRFLQLTEHTAVSESA